MISIATFNNEKAGALLKDYLAMDCIESTLLEKVAFNSASKTAKNKVSVLIEKEMKSARLKLWKK